MFHEFRGSHCNCALRHLFTCLLREDVKDVIMRGQCRLAQGAGLHALHDLIAAQIEDRFQQPLFALEVFHSCDSLVSAARAICAVVVFS